MQTQGTFTKKNLIKDFNATIMFRKIVFATHGILEELQSDFEKNYDSRELLL